jgi:hypothetical protein
MALIESYFMGRVTINKPAKITNLFLIIQKFLTRFSLVAFVAESFYLDLTIIDDDLAIDYAGEPLLCDNRVSIAQDTKHLIRESGLMVALIGERNKATRAFLIQQLLRLIEEDERLIPGTIVITELSVNQFEITADTVKFGTLDFTINL